MACKLISCHRTPVPPYPRIFLLLLIIILNSPFSIPHSYARSIPTINRDKAREVAREQVVWRDRLCPLSTAARDFLKAVYGKSSYQGLTPEQVVYGWRLRPDVWKDEPMILIGDAGGFANRITCEGIRPAIETAVNAAEAIKTGRPFREVNAQIFEKMRKQDKVLRYFYKPFNIRLLGMLCRWPSVVKWCFDRALRPS